MIINQFVGKRDFTFKILQKTLTTDLKTKIYKNIFEKQAFYYKIRKIFQPSKDVMKRFNLLNITIFLLIFSSVIYAQKDDEVSVSPKLTRESVTKKCKNLELGEVVFYFRPKYPAEARSARIGGTVEVEVNVDERGTVNGIINVKGHELLQKTAREAAAKARFTPTLCDGQPARINAFIVYNFLPYIITDNYFTPKKIEDYSDISNESVFYEPIFSLTENYKLTFGYGDKNFHSNAPLTKGDFAHFLRLTLDFLNQRAVIANKNPGEIELYSPYNPHTTRSMNDIKDFDQKYPYSESVKLLLTRYGISLVDENKNLNGKLPSTQNEVIELWKQIFGQDAVPVNFQKIKVGDKILTRGEFSLFLYESLYVLTYKVLP